MAKIKIDSNLFNRVKNATEVAGYSSVEEFITHIIEKELAKHEEKQADKQITERLRGLGYIE
ncbi:MAG: hypothetical protein ACYSSP_05350 [Planctomycetota bacterium]|jgi:metal-responsive CopG/Arc/MetJ family transcriptional regulator